MRNDFATGEAPQVLYSHQEHALNLLRKSLRNGKRRPMLAAPVGFGKTLCAANLLKSAQMKGNRSIFVVDAISLIDQTVKAFYRAGLYSLGVIQADHPMTDPTKEIQIASVQTLQRRKIPDADLILNDEAHGQHSFFLDLISGGAWSEKPVIGLSATPWSKGLGRHYDDLIKPISMQELVDTINPATGRPYLSPFKCFAPIPPDLSKVRIQDGDYVESDLSEVMCEEGLVADAVNTWIKHAYGIPTLIFAVDRAHAKKLQREFDESGIPCGYIDCFTDAGERRRIKEQLDNRDIFAVASVGTMIKGVDWAFGCISDNAPTRSHIRHVQKWGRGMRVNEGIGDLIVLDHAGNTLRLGFPTDIDRDRMCEKAPKDKRDASEASTKATPTECPKCHYLKPAKVHECPQCGFKPQKISSVEVREGELEELRHRREVERVFLGELKGYAELKGKSDSWWMAKFKARFHHFPAMASAPLKPSPETIKWLTSQNIRWAKGKGKKAA